MSDEVKGLRKEIEAGAVVPLSRGNGRLQWDFDQALTDEKGSGFFPLLIQQKSGGKVKAVIFYSLNDSNLELLQKSHSSRDYRIPRSEISRLQAKIEEIHKLAEHSDLPKEVRDFYRDFSLPDPNLLPDAWRITGKWKKHLHILWGYSSGAPESVFLPQTSISRKWTDQEQRSDLREKCRNRIGATFFPRVYQLVFFILFLPLLLFLIWNNIFSECEGCHTRKFHLNSRNLCPECQDRFYCSVHKDRKKMEGREICDIRCKRCGKHPDDDRDGYCAKHYCPEHGILMEWLDQKDVCPLKCRICGKHGKFPNGICSRHDCPVHGNQKLSDKGECLVRCKRCGKHPDDDRDGYCAKHYCPEHGILMEWLDQKDVCPLKCRICGKHGKFPNGICSRHDCPVHGNQKLNDKGECLVRCERCNSHEKLYQVNGKNLCAKHYCFRHKAWKDEQEICPVKCKKCGEHQFSGESGFCQKHHEFYLNKRKGIHALDKLRFLDAVNSFIKSDLTDPEVQYSIARSAYLVSEPAEIAGINQILRAKSADPGKASQCEEEIFAWIMEWLEKSWKGGWKEGEELYRILLQEDYRKMKKLRISN